MVSKVVIFYDEAFPYEGQRPTKEILKKLEEQASVINAAELKNAFHSEIDYFIHLHGSYFPKNAWSSLTAYLKEGKGFVGIGGAPLK